MDLVALHGMGLHSGEPCAVRFERRAGPLGFVIAGEEVGLEELDVVRTDLGVTVRSRLGGHEVDLIEHLFAALGALSIRRDLRITIKGPEIPLLDGGARELALALMMLGPPRERPRLVVDREGEIQVDDSVYQLSTASTTELEVEVEFARGGIGRQHARFDGSPRLFLDEIAHARTFGFLEDAAPLRARGRARHVDPNAVLVLDERGEALPPGAPMRPAELARHKLLDLIGDLYHFGGPPLGRISALRPGHSATHRAVQMALDRGLLRRLS